MPIYFIRFYYYYYSQEQTHPGYLAWYRKFEGELNFTNKFGQSLNYTFLDFAMIFNIFRWAIVLSELNPNKFRPTHVKYIQNFTIICLLPLNIFSNFTYEFYRNDKSLILFILSYPIRTFFFQTLFLVAYIYIYL